MIPGGPTRRASTATGDRASETASTSHTFNAERGGSDVMFSTTVALLRERGHHVRTMERDAVRVKGALAEARANVASLHSAAARPKCERSCATSGRTSRIFTISTRCCRRRFLNLAEGRSSCSHVAGRPCPSLPDGSALPRRRALPAMPRRTRVSRRFDRCAGGYVGSAALAFRTALPRLRRTFLENVSLFVTPSAMLKQFYVSEGYPESRIVHIPNFVETPARAANPEQGSYVAYLGRISEEKGIAPLLEAAGRCGIPLRIAGSGSMVPKLREVPSNVRFVGHLSHGEARELLLHARCVVVPSLCAESFGLSAAEAMALGIPVIASRIGGLPETVPPNAGILVPPGDVPALAGAMTEVWENPALAKALGAAGREFALREYSKRSYATRLLAVYRSFCGG